MRHPCRFLGITNQIALLAKSECDNMITFFKNNFEILMYLAVKKEQLAIGIIIRLIKLFSSTGYRRQTSL